MNQGDCLEKPSSHKKEAMHTQLGQAGRSMFEATRHLSFARRRGLAPTAAEGNHLEVGAEEHSKHHEGCQDTHRALQECHQIKTVHRLHRTKTTVAVSVPYTGWQLMPLSA